MANLNSNKDYENMFFDPFQKSGISLDKDTVALQFDFFFNFIYYILRTFYINFWRTLMLKLSRKVNFVRSFDFREQ